MIDGVGHSVALLPDSIEGDSAVVIGRQVLDSCAIGVVSHVCTCVLSPAEEGVAAVSRQDESVRGQVLCCAVGEGLTVHRAVDGNTVGSILIEDNAVGVSRPLCGVGGVCCGHGRRHIAPTGKAITGLGDVGGSGDRRAVVDGSARAAVAAVCIESQRVLVTLVLDLDHGGAVTLDGLLSDSLCGEAFVFLGLYRSLCTSLAALVFGFDLGVAVAVHIHLVVLNSVGGTVLAFPLGIQRRSCGDRIGGEVPCGAQTLILVPTGKVVAGFGGSLRSGDRSAVTDARHAFDTAAFVGVEVHIVGLAIIVDPDHCAAVGVDGLLLDGLGDEAFVYLCRSCSFCTCGTSQVFGCRLDLSVAVTSNILLPVLNLVGNVASCVPLDVQGQVLSRHGSRAKGEFVTLAASSIGVPASEGVAGIFRHRGSLQHSAVNGGSAANLLITVHQNQIEALAVVVHLDHSRTVGCDGSGRTASDICTVCSSLDIGKTCVSQLSKGGEVDNTIGRTGHALNRTFTCDEIAIAVCALDIVLNAIGSIRGGIPLCGIGGISGHNDTAVFIGGKIGEAGKLITTQSNSGRIDRSTVFCGVGNRCVAVCQSTVSEVHIVTVALIVQLNNRRTVTCNARLHEALYSKAGVVLGCSGSLCFGGTNHIVGIDQRVLAVEFLQIVFNRVLGTCFGNPHGINGNTLGPDASQFTVIGHFGGERELRDAGGGLIPTAKVVADTGGVSGNLGDSGARCGSNHLHSATATGIEGDIASTIRIAPFNGQGSLNGLRREGQGAMLPANGNLAGFFHRGAGSDGNGIGRGGIVELGIAQFDAETTFCVVIIANGGVIRFAVFIFVIGVRTVDITTLHVHIVHIEQVRTQRKLCNRLHIHIEKLVIFGIAEVIDILNTTDSQEGPFILVDRRLIG